MVRAIIRYLRYVLKHKYHVYIEGRKLGVGRWQLLVHDLSKFSAAEFFPYLVYFNLRGRWELDPLRKPLVKAAFDRAWLNHIHKNPHHWQHWVLRTDTEGVKVLEMPDKFVREMCADWEGVGACFNKGPGHAKRWYIENRATMALHHNTRIQVEDILGVNKVERCARPPKGWYCTRTPNHTGPCAAIPHEHENVPQPLNREPGS
jgi:hypothetical protein